MKPKRENKIIKLLETKNWNKIIKKYKDPRKVKINGNNLLHIACIRGEEEAMNYYLYKYPHLYYVSNDNGENCGQLLAKYGWHELLKKTIVRFPDSLSLVNNSGNTLLNSLVDEPFILGWILNNLDPEYLKNMKQEQITNLLNMVELIKRNKGRDIYEDIIRKLVNKGYNLNQSENPPLMYASYLNKPNLVDIFLKGGADPNIKNKYEITPLIQAAVTKSHKSAKLLLKGGADVNYAGPEGDHFPLNIALLNKDSKMVDILMKTKDLNYNYTNRNLDTPFHIALYLESKSESGLIKPSQMFRLAYNTDLDRKNIKGITPLHLMTRYKVWNNFSEILKNSEKKEEINNSLVIKDYKNMRPVDYLTEKKEKKYFKKIIKKENTIKMDKVKEDEVKFINNKKNIDKKNIKIFNSDIVHNCIYTICFTKKYPNLGVPVQKKRDDYALFMFNSLRAFRTQEGNMMGDILSMYFEYFYPFATHLILWSDSDTYYWNKKLKHTIKPLLEDNNIRFILLKLTLVPKNNTSHANIIIYDKQTNRLERFEPYGKNEMLEEKKLNKFIIKIMKKILGSENKLKLYFPKDFLNETKFQVISSDSDPANRRVGDPDGFCLAWCFWYLQTRLENPDIEPNELARISLDRILEKYKTNENPVLDYIRDYAQTLDKMKNDFLLEGINSKKLNIKKEEIYKINYDDPDKMSKLLDYINSNII